MTLSYMALNSLIFFLPIILSVQSPTTEGNKLQKLGHYFKNDKVGTVNLRIVEGNFRIYLKLSENGRYLTSIRHTYPPYRFWVRLVLLDKSNLGNSLVFSRTQFIQ